MKKIVIFIIFLFFAFLTEKNIAGELNSCPRVLASPNGRYVLGQISIVREDQFLLDTKTGRVWKVTIDSGTGFTILEPVLYFYLFSGGEMGFTPEPIEKIKKKTFNYKKLREVYGKEE